MAGAVRFFGKAALFIAIVVAVTVALLWRCGQGQVDMFYAKFTHRAESLVLGSSRAAQGLDPSLVGEGILPADALLNFAFTIANSPYGPVYLRAIQRKLPRDSSGGLFILEVNPLVVSLNDRERDDIATWRERDLTLDRQFTFSASPNYEYLLRNFRQPLYTLLWKGGDQSLHFLHENGWLELRLSMDPAATAERRKRGLQSYAGVFAKNRLSPLRIDFLGRTAAFLHNRGRVVLLRLPTSPEMAAMEQKYAPDFDQQMAQLAAQQGAEYVNWIGESARFETIDGNHLSIESARRCSAELNAYLRGANSQRLPR